MTKIQAVTDRLSGSLKDFSLPGEERSISWRVRDWNSFAEEYMVAATCLHEQDDLRVRARLQVSGHSVECALKACLASTNAPVPGTHDLTSLCSQVENAGFHVTELQAIALFQLSLHYFRDIGTGTKFKARYPTEKAEAKRAPVPEHQALSELVESLRTQSLRKIGDAA